MASGNFSTLLFNISNFGFVVNTHIDIQSAAQLRNRNSLCIKINNPNPLYGTLKFWRQLEFIVGFSQEMLLRRSAHQHPFCDIGE
jgi:hypothetical protein